MIYNCSFTVGGDYYYVDINARDNNHIRSNLNKIVNGLERDYHLHVNEFGWKIALNQDVRLEQVSAESIFKMIIDRVG